MSAPILYSAFDASKITVLSTETNKMGGKFIKLGLPGSARSIVLQTPKMRAPFGVSTYTDTGATTPTSASLDLSCDGHDAPGSPGAVFYKCIKDLDTAMLALAEKHSVEWFGKQLAPAVLEELYRPLASHRNPAYAPTVKCKVPLIDGKISRVETFDATGAKTTIEDGLTKGSTVRVIVEVAPIWFISKKQFGTTLRVAQILVVERASPRLSEFSFTADPSDEDSVVPTGAPAFLLE